MNTTYIQSEEIEQEIKQLNKKMDKAYDLQNRLSTTQKQLTLARQDVFEAYDKLSWKTYPNPALIPVN